MNVPLGYYVEERDEVHCIIVWRISCNTSFHSKLWANTTNEVIAEKLMHLADELAIPIKISKVKALECAHMEFIAEPLRKYFDI